jgi:hypothetical protein
LVAEDEEPSCIRQHLLEAYGDAAVDVSTIWWWKDGSKKLKQEEQHSITSCGVVSLPLQ